jgi:hypothetical protein
MKTKRFYYFDGTMLVSVGKTRSFKNIIAFEQTLTKREINKEYPDVEIHPDLFFVFKSKESVNTLIRALEELRKNFESEVRK